MNVGQADHEVVNAAMGLAVERAQVTVAVTDAISVLLPHCRGVRPRVLELTAVFAPKIHRLERCHPGR